MNNPEEITKDFSDPKYSFLRAVQTLCNDLNNRNKETKKDDSNFIEDKPIILTQSYIITGEIIPFSKLNKEYYLKNNRFDLMASKAIFDACIKNIEENSTYIESEDFVPKILLLKDVTIRSLSSNQITKLPSVNLFADQIVGFTFGHLD